jgi:hypothetical protein
MSTPKRKLFAGADNSEDESANMASMDARKASPKKAAMEDKEINKPSSERRVSDPQKMEDTAWIRENPKVKKFICLLTESIDVITKYNAILTGSAAIMLYTVNGYKSGKLTRRVFESIIDKLSPVNDLDLVCSGPINIKDIIKYKFNPVDDKPVYKTDYGSMIHETNGIPFVKHANFIDASSVKSISMDINIEIIIPNPIGKKEKPNTTTLGIELGESAYNIRALSIDYLISAYRGMDEESRQAADAPKKAVLSMLKKLDVFTPDPVEEASRADNSARRRIGAGKKLAF